MKFPRILLSLVLLAVTSLSAASRPNVVFLLADDLGYRDIGCYGGPVKTPVLDKLAAGGVRFTDFHSGAPGCSHSRASFLTGRNHHRTGVYSVISERLHRMHLLESETTIAEVLKQNGFATAHFGKWHLGMPVQKRDNPTPADHGFDHWFGLVNGPGKSHKDPTNFIRNGERVGMMKGYSCQIVVDEALTWLDEKRDADEPFFLNLWFNEPHAPIAAPDEIVSQYGALDDQAAIYSGTIDNTDRAIGRLVARLEKLGELDNTIIVYSSDNGSYRQERNGELRGKKGSQFEGGHRVPGIFYWKGGIPGGRVEDEPAAAVDLLPTLCGLIGIDKPGGVHLDGSDLAPLLTRSDTFERHQPLFWISGANMVVRIGDHTLFASGTARSPIDSKTAKRLMEQIRGILGDDLEKGLDDKKLRDRLFSQNMKIANPEANRLRHQLRDLYYFNEAWIPELKKSQLGRVQLYDLSKDLGQQKDIAKESPEIVARMKKQAAAIYRSVMADAPEWPTPKEQAAAGNARKFGEIAARCDVYKNHLRGQPNGKTHFTDYRKLLERNDIDVVTIATPDHWHTKIAIEAMQAGKDVYCEKPLTLTIDEGKLICRVVKQTGRVLQVGTQQRSEFGGRFLQAVAMVRDGRIGELKRVIASTGGGQSGGPFSTSATPATLDWNMWLGQAPLVPYTAERCHVNFRWWREYAGGQMTDWGAHHVDIALWAIDLPKKGLVTLEGKGDIPTIANGYNMPAQFDVLCKMPNGVELQLVTGQRQGIMLEGAKGRFFVNRGGIFGKPVDQLKDDPLPERAISELYRGKRPGNHMGNFFECVKSRDLPISDAFSHHRAVSILHLANLCLQLGRKLTWDLATEQIVGDDVSNAMQGREQRKGFEILV